MNLRSSQSGLPTLYTACGMMQCHIHGVSRASNRSVRGAPTSLAPSSVYIKQACVSRQLLTCMEAGGGLPALRGAARVVLPLQRLCAGVPQLLLVTQLRAGCRAPALPAVLEGQVQVDEGRPVGRVVVGQHIDRQRAAAAQQLPVRVICCSDQPAFCSGLRVSLVAVE